MGVQFALMWAVLAFLLNYVPNIGAVISAVPPMIQVLLFNGILRMYSGRRIVFSCPYGHRQYFRARMMGHRLGMSTWWYSFIVNLGMAARPVGMLLSVPLTSVCKSGWKPPKAVANWRFYWGQADRKVGYRDEATSDTIRTFIFH
ncbi:inner membrane protein [Escherichia coli]|uniref:Inner membrane protein n=1 Tax=Escherichia coli TaxID=562 RepID=A0A377BXF2_ECOLX|nr:inner membrane protein [Escherichia coli]